MIELEIRGKEQDVRSKELENSLKKIQVIKQASELVRDGVIAADKVAIDINGIYIFLFDGKQVQTNAIMLENEPDKECTGL